MSGPPIRALLDANVFVSYLLIPAGSGPIRVVVEAAFVGRYRLLVSASLLAELAGRVATKRYLAERITGPELAALLSAVTSVAEVVRPPAEAFPAVVRDAKDDHVFVHAKLGEADYLVTGDGDLLELDGKVDPLRIVTPAEFARILGLLPA